VIVRVVVAGVEVIKFVLVVVLERIVDLIKFVDAVVITFK
jgi:hypothetical protein